MHDELRKESAGLLRLMQQEMPAARDLQIRDLKPAQAGSSTENWVFDARWSEAGEQHDAELILRMAPRSEVVLVDRQDEYWLLRALGNAGFAVPKTYCFDSDGSVLGRPGMVLQRCRGSARRDLLSERSGLDVAQRQALATDIVDLLSSLHSFDPAALRLPARFLAGSEDAARGLLDRYAREVTLDPETFGVEMKLAAWWLRDHLPPPPDRLVVVHGDFRPANLLVDGGHVSAVLDWEFAHVGDPAEDLGWYLARIYRPEHFIAGHWTPRDFIARYEQRTGVTVAPETVRYWMVFAIFKLASIALSTIKAFRGGDSGRIIRNADQHVESLLRSISDDQPGWDP